MNTTHVSKLNQERSRQNIQTKIDILKHWINTSIPPKIDENGNSIRDINGEIIFEWTPSSMLDFSKWDGSQNSPQYRQSFGDIRTVSRETMNKKYNNDLCQAVTQTIALIKAKKLRQIEEHDRLGIIQKLTRELDYFKILASSLATDIAQLRSQYNNSEIEVRRLTKAVSNNKKEMERLLGEKDARISELNSLLLKIRPLNSITN